jgi:hypothetical protein
MMNHEKGLADQRAETIDCVEDALNAHFSVFVFVGNDKAPFRDYRNGALPV